MTPEEFETRKYDPAFKNDARFGWWASIYDESVVRKICPAVEVVDDPSEVQADGYVNYVGGILDRWFSEGDWSKEFAIKGCDRYTDEIVCDLSRVPEIAAEAVKLLGSFVLIIGTLFTIDGTACEMRIMVKNLKVIRRMSDEIKLQDNETKYRFYTPHAPRN